MQSDCRPDCLDCLLDKLFEPRWNSATQVACGYSYGDLRRPGNPVQLNGNEGSSGDPSSERELHSIAPVLSTPTHAQVRDSVTTPVQDSAMYTRNPPSVHLEDANIKNAIGESRPLIFANIYEAFPMLIHLIPPAFSTGTLTSVADASAVSSNSPVNAQQKGAKIPPKYGDEIKGLLAANPRMHPKAVILELEYKFWHKNVAPRDWPGTQRLKTKVETVKRKYNRTKKMK